MTKPTISREKFVTALNHIKPAIDNKESCAQSSYVIFLDDHIVADNEILHIKSPFQTGITGAVKAEELIQVLNRSSSPVFTMEMNESMILFKSGRSKVGLQLHEILRKDSATFNPELGKTFDLDQEFIKALDLCSSCCTDNLSERALSAVNVEKDHMVACDNFQSMMVSMECPSFKGIDQFLIPSMAVPAIVGIAADKLYQVSNPDFENYYCAENSETKERVYFEAVDCTENPYPDFVELFDVAETSKDFQFPEGVIDAINKAEIFARNTIKKEEISVKIIVQNNLMKIYGEGANGFYEESFDYKSDEEFSFIVPPKILASIVNKKASSIQIIKEDTPRILFNMEDYKYMITIDSVEE